MGGMNYHIEVRFDDGIIWIARIRRFNATSPPAALRDYIIQTPGQSCGSWIHFEEKLPGKSLRWSLATQQQRKKVMSQLADTFVELQKYPFHLLDYHMSSLRLTLDLIVREVMYSQQAVDAYLIHRFLMDLVPRVLPPVRHDEKF
ncbi:hypothetical protein EV126DRAFT_436770 [Verticillium dahliae]|nr:hypothetical protein EV126DRAFT_436770 [Verticillium dahliae]